MSVMERLRNLVRGDDGRKHRDAVRASAHVATEQARLEVRKSRAQRELLVMEEQYRRRAQARGRHG